MNGLAATTSEEWNDARREPVRMGGPGPRAGLSRRGLIRSGLVAATGAVIYRPGPASPRDFDPVHPESRAFSPWPILELVGVGGFGQRALRCTMELLRRSSDLAFLKLHRGRWFRSCHPDLHIHGDRLSTLVNLGGADEPSTYHDAPTRAHLTLVMQRTAPGPRYGEMPARA